MELCNIFGYGEIREGHYRSPSTLMGAYNKISDKKFIAVTISDKKEVYPALRKFFAQRDPMAVVSFWRPKKCGVLKGGNLPVMAMWGYLPPANFIEHNPRKLAEIASDETETPGLYPGRSLFYGR